MQAYVVGGAVRDELLGLPVVDRDWVVVGATPEQMTALGYTPVGRDFPVFLHPETHEEYALARTERKSGRGYKGFTVYAAPDVTLEDDLARRDLTINAMARTADGRIVDPYGGQADLEAGVLRHVGEAFHEDPVRILRVARFAARYRFRVHDETMAMMARMVEVGEADHLVAERVWQEFERGLGEAHPHEQFMVLKKCGALARLMPEIDAIVRGERGDGVLDALERSAAGGAPVTVRFAIIAWFAGAGAEAGLRTLCDRLRAPVDEREIAVLACRCKPGILGAGQSGAEDLLQLIKLADALRRKARFDNLLRAGHLAEPALVGSALVARIGTALEAANSIDGGEVAARAATPAGIPAAIDAARLEAIRAALKAA